MTKVAVVLFSFLFALPLLAEPFVLAETALGASRWAPDDVRIGAGPDGFLLGGTASHHPVVIPLGPNGGPLVEGSLPVTESDAWTRGGISNASSVGEPVWVDGRWVMLLSPDHLLPNRVAIAEIGDDGTRLGEPKVLPWTRFRQGELAWNGRAFLAAATVDRTTTILRDLSVRVISDDLATAGEEYLLALDVHGFEILGTGDGFVISWWGSSGNWLQRLNDEGQPVGEAITVSGRSSLTTNGYQTLVTWWEEIGEDRVLRAMVLDENGVLTSPVRVVTLSHTERATYIVEWTDGAFTLAWQPVTYEGQYFGGEITVQRLDASGQVIEEPWLLPGLVGGEVIAGSASRGDQMLLAWTRHISGVGEPIWSTIIDGRQATTQRLVSVTEATPQNLELSSSGDGTFWGAWVGNHRDGIEPQRRALEREWRPADARHGRRRPGSPRRARHRE